MSKAGPILAIALLVGAIGPVLADTSKNAPQRVVSMNVCTDQLAILIADEGQLFSVSQLAKRSDTSVLADRASRYVTNHGLAEEIFSMRPDLIVAGSYSTRATVSLLERLGFRVEVFEPASSFEDIRKNILRMGQVLNRIPQAQGLVRAFDGEVEWFLQTRQSRGRAALYYHNSYTSGGGTLAAEVVEHAGFSNLGTVLGYRGTTKLPLEVLVTARPDLTIGRDEMFDKPALASENFGHPALLAISGRTGRATIADKYWICGAPFTAEAVRRLMEYKHSSGGPQKQ